MAFTHCCIPFHASGHTNPMRTHEYKPDFHKLFSSEPHPVRLLASQLIFFFFLGSIGGFLWEVLLFLVKDGQFHNRGFLYGPWLPVYGIGAVLFYLLFGNPKQIFFMCRNSREMPTAQDYALHLLLSDSSLSSPEHERSFQMDSKDFDVFSTTGSLSNRKSRKHPLTIFLLSALTGSLIELAVGCFLDLVWNLRYWDYTGYLFDFHGYICLWSVLGFGVAGTLWICFLSHPITKFWLMLPAKIRNGSNTILILLFLTDCAAALIFPNQGNGITF